MGALGVGALAASLIERYTVAKENKRDRFAKLVLTNDFFEELTEFWRLHDICRAALDIRERGHAIIMIDDEMVPLTSVSRLETEFLELCRKIVVVHKKVQQGGSFFLAPAKIRTALGGLAVFIERADFNTADAEFLQTLAVKMNELSQMLRQEVGLK